MIFGEGSVSGLCWGGGGLTLESDNGVADINGEATG